MSKPAAQVVLGTIVSGSHHWALAVKVGLRANSMGIAWKLCRNAEDLRPQPSPPEPGSAREQDPLGGCVHSGGQDAHEILTRPFTASPAGHALNGAEIFRNVCLT